MIGSEVIRGPVGQLIGLVVWLIIFPLLLGSINGWYLQAKSAGVVSGERFDRVVFAGSNASPEDAWQGVTALSSPFAHADNSNKFTPSDTTAYSVTESGTGCQIGTVALASGQSSAQLIDAATWYTPLGSKVTTANTAAASTTTVAVQIAGCEHDDGGSVFGSGGLSPLIEIILQAAGLAPPIALLFALGTFGSSFMRNMGQHPILAAVMTAISFLLLATLLNTFIPFVSDAFEAIDANRFLMYDEGLGAVSSVIGNFFGVVIVASIMTVAWQVLQALRGRDALSNQGVM